MNKPSANVEKADKKSAFSLTQPDFAIEKDLLRKNYTLIAGIDEAGRGSLAGPLSVGCVIYSGGFIESPPDGISMINDSKKLSAKKRAAALEFIEQHALCATARLVSHEIVDALNINGATKFAIERLILEMPVRPDVILLDGNFSFDFDIPCISVKGGDARSFSIASASIAAKVRRDKIMEKMDALYTGYGFAVNKGYGTLLHRNAILSAGPSPIHRKSYEPLKGMLSGESTKL
jgi:ribonuclease HII